MDALLDQCGLSALRDDHQLFDLGVTEVEDMAGLSVDELVGLGVQPADQALLQSYWAAYPAQASAEGGFLGAAAE